MRNYRGKRLQDLEEKFDIFTCYLVDWFDEGFWAGIGAHFIFAIIGAIIGLILTFIIFKSFNLVFFLVFVGLGFVYPLISTGLECTSDCIKANRMNKIIESNNRIIENENRITISNCQRQADIIQKELSKTSNLLIETENLLKTYYEMDIIYPKYRNIVAISSFYEYLVTGRCSTLEGHGGVYDTYEYESRLDRIVTKLDDILESLEEIKSNQFQLYTAINSGFIQSYAMYNNILSSLDNINNNQQVNNFYSMMTAQNTEFMRLEHLYNRNY